MRNPFAPTRRSALPRALAAAAALLPLGCGTLSAPAGCTPAAPAGCARSAPAPAPAPVRRPPAAAAAGDTIATAQRRDTLRDEIAAMLQRSASAWNRGDLDAFMEDYAPGPRTTFVTARGVLHGRDAIRERYAPRFAPGGVHDSLSFEGLEVDPLGKDVLHAVAFYVLARGDSVVARGPTSLVMVRDGTRWRIVHDHSS